MSWLAGIAMILGTGFFVLGTIGLLRLPDGVSRLHALTKADTLGLGFIALGVALGAGDLMLGAKAILAWLLILAGSAVASALLGAMLDTAAGGADD